MLSSNLILSYKKLKTYVFKLLGNIIIGLKIVNDFFGYFNEKQKNKCWNLIIKTQNRFYYHVCK